LKEADSPDSKSRNRKNLTENDARVEEPANQLVRNPQSLTSLNGLHEDEGKGKVSDRGTISEKSNESSSSYDSEEDQAGIKANP
jgi:hypothetical protein